MLDSVYSCDSQHSGMLDRESVVKGMGIWNSSSFPSPFEVL